MNKTILKVMNDEMTAIQRMIEQADGAYADACRLLKACRGKVVFMGVGKSGHVGEKLAATFSSTGTPAFFVHATEAVHGDMGMIEARDVAVILSNSGTTAEAVRLLPVLGAVGCKTIAFTAGADSPLIKGCDAAIVYPKCREADHLDLAPTVSSTLALVLGDAIACALSQDKGFTREDFYKFHPAGALGDRLKQDKR